MDSQDARRKAFREDLRVAIRAATVAGVPPRAIEDDMAEIGHYVMGLSRAVGRAQRDENNLVPLLGGSPPPV